MPTFQEFTTKAKMRPDFGDMIQVRYRHSDGDDYDTWVSGREALQRLESETAEQRLDDLSGLTLSAVQEAARRLPEEGKKKLKRRFIDRFADEVKGAIGGNPIGDSFSNAVRGQEMDEDPHEAEREKWRALLQESAFRVKVLELAWIQLEGSFPDDESPLEGSDDWM